MKRLSYDQPGETAVPQETRYVWAGWRCIAELDAADAIGKRMVWGLDQNQALHLGDGNGALLWTDDVPAGESHFSHYDGNGNVVGLSDAAGELTAEYRYGAFGELLAKRGEQADANLYRYSTKPAEETGNLYYYGYRHYDPVHGRWLSRDPLGEAGGVNTTGFVGNDPVNRYDELGLSDGFLSRLGQAAGHVAQGFSDWANDHAGEIGGAAGAGAVVATGAYTTADDAMAVAAAWGGPHNPWAQKAKDCGIAALKTAIVGGLVGAELEQLEAELEAAAENAGYSQGLPPELRDKLAAPVSPRAVNYTEAFKRNAVTSLAGGVFGKVVGPVLGKVKVPWLGRAAKTPLTPSAFARSQQGSELYPSVDRFRDITLKKGTIIYGGAPGQSSFYTTGSAIRRTGDSATGIFQGLQVAPSPRHGYRAGMTAYEVMEDVPAAFGRTLANPQNGAGGLPQIVIPNWQGSLKPIYTEGSVAMKIDPRTAEVNLHGIKLSGDLKLEVLQAASPNQFSSPLISNGEWQTYRIADSEAASQLVFRRGRLWQIRIAISVPGDANGQPSEMIERERHLVHEKLLAKEIASSKLRCPNGSEIDLCFDDRSLSSVIVVTYPPPDLPT